MKRAGPGEVLTTIPGMRLRASTLLLAVAIAAGCSTPAAPERSAAPDRGAIVARVVDGDTVQMRDGARVRLLQVDAPDVGECYHDQATAALKRRLPVGSRVTLRADAGLDDRDRYDRLLRYVVDSEGANMSAALVEAGAAAPYFYRGVRGKHAALLETAAQRAKKDGSGLWGACPRTALDPDRALDATR